MRGIDVVGTIVKLAGTAAVLIMPSFAFAQSCAMCYTSAAAAKAGFIAGLRSGILILLFPPLAICLSLGVLAYRKRNDFNYEQEPDQVESDDELAHADYGD